jgi:hypothetical protein
MKNVSKDFCSIHWGEDDAKGDARLDRYFLRIPEFSDILDGSKRYIIGRKGTGKTAILQQVKNENMRYDRSCRELSLKDFPLQEIRDQKDKSANDKSKYVPIWRFLILVDLAQEIVQREDSTPNTALSELKGFLRNNFTNISFNSTLTRLRTYDNKVKVGGPFSISMGYTESISTPQDIHYHRASEYLVGLLKNLECPGIFYILFDELDEGWSSNDKNLRLIILSLMRSIETLVRDLAGYISFRPILALRSDIFEALEDSDLNKLDDFIVRLNWSPSRREVNHSLFRLVNERINATLHLPEHDNPWSLVTTDGSRPSLTQENLWKFISMRTFNRPRDIVKYLKYCQKLRFSGALNKGHVSRVEPDYSRWFFSEFKDEIHSYLPVWRESCEIFKKFKNGKFTFDHFCAEINKNKEITEWLKNNSHEAEYIAKILFDFSVVGNYHEQNKKWFFKYKDEGHVFDPSMDMICHFGFAKHFGHPVY